MALAILSNLQKLQKQIACEKTLMSSNVMFFIAILYFVFLIYEKCFDKHKQKVSVQF
jgi:hypothetical protein